MARINIEETWWHQSRRDNLGKLLEGIPFTHNDLIESVMVRAWRGAQEYWQRGELIPGAVFLTYLGSDAILLADLARIHVGPSPGDPIIPKPVELIFVHRLTSEARARSSDMPAAIQRYLADAHRNYIYVHGSETAFKWAANARRQRVEAAKKSAKRPRDARGRLLPKSSGDPADGPAVAGVSLVSDQRVTSEIQHSVSGSVSVSGSDSRSGSMLFAEGSRSTPSTQDPNAQVNPDGPSATALTWRSYKQAYLQRHKTPPTWNQKVAGQFKSFTTRVPKDEAPLIAAFFVGHNDAYYVKNLHPVWALLRDAEKLRTEWQTGIRMTNGRARQVEAVSDSLDVGMRYMEKKKAEGLQ